MGRSHVHTETDAVRIYTMRELNQRTAEVMREIEENDAPAVITKRGRFVAVIMPVKGAERRTLRFALEEAGAKIGSRSVGISTEELAASLGVHIPSSPDREVE